MYGGRIETNTPFALNGAMGRLVRVAASGQTTWRLIVPRQASVVQMETNVPSSHADAYWVQLESMLATWGWDD
jgi:hypothetical protein